MALRHQSSSTPAPTNKLYRFAFAQITMISLLALLCAGLFVSIANDMYAFVKHEETVTISVDSPMTVRQLATVLKQNGIINNPTVFSLYVQSKQQAERLEAFQGCADLNTAMSYREILLALRQ